MIEMAQFDEMTVRVTGFRRGDRDGRTTFVLVVLVPGVHASDELIRLLARKRITLTLYLDDGEKESHAVSVELHEIREAGNPSAPVYRHQIEFIERQEGDPPEPNEIETELAAILARFDRLLDALEQAGVVRREVVISQRDAMRNAR
jgi:hypothetical protein